MARTNANKYQQIIERVFFSHYSPGAREVVFKREELARAAGELRIPLPKNLGDLIYSFRYRAGLPASIDALLGEGEEWVIRPAGRSQYRMEISGISRIVPRAHQAEIKIPDSTPGVIARYALSDEQALLAKLRYNRLLDIFLRLTCYSLQSHLRTTVRGLGQVETDELYVGLDRRGAHYAVPVQAKGGSDTLNVVQIEQDFAICAAKFPLLVARPVAAQFIEGNLIALFEFEKDDAGAVRVAEEKHYRLVPAAELSDSDLERYRQGG